MSRRRPCKHKDFGNKLRQIGFDGHFSGTKYQLMIDKWHRLTIQLYSECSATQLSMLIREDEHIINRTIIMNEWHNGDVSLRVGK